MQDLRGYKGCKVIIRDDEGGKTIAETIIVEYNNKTQSISVEIHNFDKYSYDRVSILILLKTTVFECKGNIRKLSGSRYTEIALYQGHEKEDDRTTKRYEVNFPARIEKVLISEHALLLTHPLDVIVKNISSDGVLLKANTKQLSVNAVFQLKMVIGGNETLINSTVIRIDNVTSDSAEYGCQFNYQYGTK